MPMGFLLLNLLMNSTKMKFKIIFPLLFVILFLVACGGEKNVSSGDQVFLAGGDTLSLPLDNSTYYLSKTLFQFENDGQEYLLFQNDRFRGKPRFLIFDIDRQREFKSVPLYEEGPNGIPVIFGGWPVGMDRFIVTTHSSFFYIVNEQGMVLQKFRLWNPDDDGEDRMYANFCISSFYSYYASPAILQDSLLYFKQDEVGYPHKPEDWKNISMFAYANLNTGKMAKTELKFPSIFGEEEVMRIKSYDSSFSYAYTGKDVSISFY